MPILAIECANFSSSVALFHQNQVIAFQQRFESFGNDTYLIPMIQELFKESTYTLNDVKKIAVTLGPGSFTGIRVGLAAAQGFSLALDLPILALSTFELIARTYQRSYRISAPLLITLESKRDESFVIIYDSKLKVIKEPIYLSPANLSSYIDKIYPLLIGDAAPYFKLQENISTLNEDFKMPTAIDLALSVQEKLQENCSFDDPIPFYLRPPEVNLHKI